jgi:subtilisin family serine protease
MPIETAAEPREDTTLNDSHTPRERLHPGPVSPIIPHSDHRTPMRRSTFMVPEKASVSVASVMGRLTHGGPPPAAFRAAGFAGEDPASVRGSDLVSVLVEAEEGAGFENDLRLAAHEEMKPLGGGFHFARVGPAALRTLVDDPAVGRIQALKESQPTLEAIPGDVGLRVSPEPHPGVAETGRGVLIGIVDTGFDLSHPMFRDGNGQLRVEALLDQCEGDRVHDAEALERGWASGGNGPGKDLDGHGTHVAAIAGGSAFLERSGIAPDVRFLLVRTDFRRTAPAVSWIFDRAGPRPCVVNLSLGHHYGSHDGTDAEERLHASLSGPGRLIVVAAGNERDDRIHVGARMVEGQRETVHFDVLRQPEGPPYAVLTFWYHQDDAFEVELVTPGGQVVTAPAIGTADRYQTALLDLEVSRRRYVWSSATMVHLSLSFQGPHIRYRDLMGWGVRITCRRAVSGRIDGWFHNSGFGTFREHPFVEEARTVGLPATGDGSIAVGSHVSRNRWRADLGDANDGHAVAGRISRFSSAGPTRDGRWKPDVCAPGQYLTAALADGCRMAGWDERALVDERLLTLEGTSMAAPVVSGIVALLLQRKPRLTVAEARDLISRSARRDIHTGPARWDPAYGFGKVDVARALDLI